MNIPAAEAKIHVDAWHVTPIITPTTIPKKLSTDDRILCRHSASRADISAFDRMAKSPTTIAVENPPRILFENAAPIAMPLVKF